MTARPRDAAEEQEFHVGPAEVHVGVAWDEDERALRTGLLVGPELRLRFEAVAGLLRRRRGRERVDVGPQVHVVVDLVLHPEVGDAFRDGVALVDELELHGAFAPLGHLLAPGTADEVFVEVGRGVVAGDGAGVDHDETAAAGRELRDAGAFVGLEVAAALAVDDEHVGAREFFVGGEGLHALGVGVADRHLHAGRVEQRLPVASEGRVVMVSGAMGLGAATEEDAERGRGVGGEDRGESEQGEEAAHGGRLSAKVQKCKGAKVAKGAGAGVGELASQERPETG